MANARRGEVWQIDFGLAAKARPALVLGCDIAEESRTAVGFTPLLFYPVDTLHDLVHRLGAGRPSRLRMSNSARRWARSFSCCRRMRSLTTSLAVAKPPSCLRALSQANWPGIRGILSVSAMTAMYFG